MKIPKSRPQLDRTKLLDWLYESTDSDNIPADGILILAIRGYYLDSFGKEGENDRNVYDDACFVLEFSGRTCINATSFNFNTDPSKHRDGMAYVKEGTYSYRKWKHRGQYWALGQHSAVDLDRDGPGGIMSGWYGINIHKGGLTNTWSLGCQTVPTTQWEEFQYLVYKKMDAYQQSSIKYVLTSEKVRRAWEVERESERILREREHLQERSIEDMERIAVDPVREVITAVQQEPLRVPKNKIRSKDTGIEITPPKLNLWSRLVKAIAGML